MTSSMLVFRQNIQFLLRFYKQRQYVLAEALDVVPTHLSHFLNYRPALKKRQSVAVRRGKRKTDARWLSASKFDAIADFFGVELWMLFRDDLPQHVVAAQQARRLEPSRLPRRARQLAP